MAAILCQGLNEICRAICLPCRACGLGCRSLGEVLSSPFFPYLAVTYGLNIPSVVYGIRGIASMGSHRGYCGAGTQWLLANTILAASHLIASWYLVHVIRQDREMSQWVYGNQNHQQQQGATTVTPTASSSQYHHYGTTPVVAATSVSTQPLHAVTTGTDDPTAAKLEQGTYQPPPPTNPSIFAKAVPIVQALRPTTPTAVATTTSTSRASSGGPTSPGQRLPGASNSLTRIKYVLCYDPLVAIYILVFVVWSVWQTIGTSRAFILGENNANQQCALIQDWVMISVVCGYLYMGLVGIAFLCSLCCLR